MMHVERGNARNHEPNGSGATTEVQGAVYDESAHGGAWGDAWGYHYQYHYYCYYVSYVFYHCYYYFCHHAYYFLLRFALLLVSQVEELGGEVSTYDKKAKELLAECAGRVRKKPTAKGAA